MGKKYDRPAIMDLPYSAGLMSQSCWFIEFKKLIQLIAGGANEDAIKQECLENNLFGYAKEYRAKRVYGYLKNRATMLDDSLIEIFMSGDLQTQKLVNLIAIVRGDRLFFEFLFEIYREKVILGNLLLEDADFNAFFREKGNQSEIVDSWSDSTKKHLRSNYSTCMADAGLINVEGKKKYITAPLLESRLITYLRDCDEEPLLKSITGVA